MIIKNVEKGQEARQKLIKGVNTIADAVGSTLGARGRTVLMESENHVGGIIVTKDGVSVSKGINLMDPVENLAAMIMREASDKTANSAGDGPQPLYSKVATPTGFVEMGDLKVGDVICGTHNSVQRVDGVFEKGDLEMYEVYFKGRGEVECSKDHLWTVWVDEEIKTNMTTAEILEKKNEGQRLYVELSIVNKRDEHYQSRMSDLFYAIQPKKHDYEYFIFETKDKEELIKFKELAFSLGFQLDFHFDGETYGAVEGEGCLIEITEIIPTGEIVPMRCIKVSNPDHLYLTNHYIPTHNTTTSMVLAQAIIHAATNLITPEDNVTQVLRDVQEAALRVAEELTEMSTEITSDKLVDVATISANGDADIGQIIADAYNQVGLSGVVTVENSATAETYSEVVSGMKVDRGFSSKYFVTDHKKQEAVMDKPYILVTDQPVSNINDILPILEFIMQGKRSLLIIGEVEENALNTLNVNKIKSGLRICTIVPPSFGYKRHQIMQDIAIATGAKYFSEQTGDNLLMATIDDCGRADKVVSGRFNTIIFDAEGSGGERVAELQEQLAVETSAHEKDFLKERIANLGGGVGVIKVGANSDIEQKEKKDRVDDAVCAVKAALEEGILPGGGVALKDIAAKLEVTNKGAEILQLAILAPMVKILSNAGINVKPSDFDKGKQLAKEGVGINVATGSYCHMMSVGIIDPTKVSKEALKNSVSVATTLLSTETVITNVRQM